MLYEKQLLTKNNKMFLNIKDFFLSHQLSITVEVRVQKREKKPITEYKQIYENENVLFFYKRLAFTFTIFLSLVVSTATIND